MPDLASQQLTSLCVELWNAGKSAGEIAKILDLRFGRRFTRNAVMGRVHRAQAQGGAQRKVTTRNTPSVLSVRRSPPSRGPGGRLRFRPRPRLLETARFEVQAAAAPSLALPFEDLALPSGSMVRWHAGEGCAYLAGEDAAAPQWCNAKTVAGSPWCAYHYRQMRA